MWVKFDGMDVECFCNEDCKKCNDSECKEYVVKFMEIQRSIVPELTHLNSKFRKVNLEIKKSINKFKI
jgi:hypothetical protein